MPELRRALKPERAQRQPEPATAQTLVWAQVLCHSLAEHGLARLRYPSFPLDSDYCQEHYCWMMTWASNRTGLNCLRLRAGSRITKVMPELLNSLRV